MLFGGQNSNTGAIKITCQEQKAKAQFKSDAATRPGLGFKTHMSVNLAIWPREQRPEGDAPPQQACPRWHLIKNKNAAMPQCRQWLLELELRLLRTRR